MTWQRTRQIVFDQHNGKCAECGSTKTLDVHHLVPKIKGGGDELPNLILLCRKHHRLEHNNPFRRPKIHRRYGGKIIKVSDEVHKRLVKRAGWSQPLTEIIEELLNIAEGRSKK